MLETNYVGLSLKNPIIVASSGLTSSVEKIKLIESYGAACVVLKSLFEEQIMHEKIMSSRFVDQQIHEIITDQIRNNITDEYLKLIKECKENVNIPVFASINCYTKDEWYKAAIQIEKAGADGLELNISSINLNENIASSSIESNYLEIIAEVRKMINIPLVVKLSPFFTNLLEFISKLKLIGVNGFVLFNRFYEPDIDIDSLKFTSSSILSSRNEIKQSLRWVGIISGLIANIDISASTGIHTDEDAIKQLLAGATTIQLCSTLYKNGIDEIAGIKDFIEEWMYRYKYNSVDEFRGLLNYSKIDNPVFYERCQFMKHFSGYE